jgi:hypothetical protein
MAELSVKVPIRFSEKAQKDLYETCMAYKELAEMRGAENEKLRETVKAAWGCVNSPIGCHECRMVSGGCTLLSAMRELGIMVRS